MMDRVVFWPPGTESSMIWASAVSDEKFIELRAQFPWLPILYFSVEDYRHAMAGLAPAEQAETIRLRLKKWSPAALGYALEWLCSLLQRQLVLMAHQMAAEPDAKILAEFAHVAEQLALLWGDGRFDHVRFVPLLRILSESSAMLTVDYAQRNDQDQQARARLEAERLGAALSRVTQGSIDGVSPATPFRGIYIQPSGEDVRMRFEEEGWFAGPWRNGGLWVMPASQVARVVAGAQSWVLFWNGSKLSSLLAEKEGAALDRALSSEFAAAERAGSDMANDPRFPAYAAKRELDHMLLARAVARRSDREAPEITDELEAIWKDCTARLAGALTHVPIKEQDAGRPYEETRQRLQQEARESALLFIELMAASEWSMSRRKLQRFVQDSGGE